LGAVQTRAEGPDECRRNGERIAWALDRERARGHNKAAVALANKLARIAWAVWRNGQPFTQKESPASNP